MYASVPCLRRFASLAGVRPCPFGVVLPLGSAADPRDRPVHLALLHYQVREQLFDRNARRLRDARRVLVKALRPALAGNKVLEKRRGDIQLRRQLRSANSPPIEGDLRR